MLGHHVVHLYGRGTQGTLHSMASLAVVNQDLSFKTVHTVLYQVIPLEYVIFRKSLMLVAMSSPDVQMVTYGLEVATVHLKEESNYAIRDYGEQLLQIPTGIMPIQR